MVTSRAPRRVESPTDAGVKHRRSNFTMKELEMNQRYQSRTGGTMLRKVVVGTAAVVLAGGALMTAQALSSPSQHLPHVNAPLTVQPTSARGATAPTVTHESGDDDVRAVMPTPSNLTDDDRRGFDDHGRETEPGDDRGGHEAEPGDDRGGHEAEPGDDRGGHEAEPGDDRGGESEVGSDGGSGDDSGGHGGRG
jgi:hypothetical protein